jgi:SMODS-associating 4TM effector domain
MSSPDSGNRIAERQRSPEAVELLRAFHHAYGSAKHWHAARLAGTVLVALAAPVVIIFAPSLEHPLGAIAGAWVLASRLVLRPAQERATGFAVAVQEMFDRQVLGLLPARTPQPPAYEQIHQQARRCRSDPDRDWYSVRPQLPSGSAVLIAQRSGAVWSRRLYQEWAVVLAALAGGWTLLTVSWRQPAARPSASTSSLSFCPCCPRFWMPRTSARRTAVPRPNDPDSRQLLTSASMQRHKAADPHWKTLGRSRMRSTGSGSPSRQYQTGTTVFAGLATRLPCTLPLVGLPNGSMPHVAFDLW